MPADAASAGMLSGFSYKQRRALHQAHELALAVLDNRACAKNLGVDVVRLGSHSLSVNLYTAPIDEAAGLAHRSRQLGVGHKIGQIDLALVVYHKVANGIFRNVFRYLGAFELRVEGILRLLAGTFAMVKIPP